RRLGRFHIALLGALLALVAAAPAQAAVRVTQAPTISGFPRVGEKLTATGGAWSPTSGVTISRPWLRCDDAEPPHCDWPSKPTSTTFTLTTADKGKRMRVVLTVTSGWEFDYEVSTSTGTVGASTPTPTPTPTPTRTPTPTPTPTRTPTPTPTPTKTPTP